MYVATWMKLLGSKTLLEAEASIGQSLSLASVGVVQRLSPSSGWAHLPSVVPTGTWGSMSGRTGPGQVWSMAPPSKTPVSAPFLFSAYRTGPGGRLDWAGHQRH